MIYSYILLKKALNLRKKGHSYQEISDKLKISKSTAYLWCKSIILDEKAKKRIFNRLSIGMIKARKILRLKRKNIIKNINNNADKYLKNLYLNNKINKLLCSFLYWCEGEKDSNSINFVNSDSTMIKVFLKLLRSSFKLDEKKFRVLIHLHEYHNENEIKKYWSKITNIPLNQFVKSYLKFNTGKNIKKGYMGTVSIRYYDYKIALELKLIYNKFAKSLL